MTRVSEQMYGVICKFCFNCEGQHCKADVPYYAVSINCKYFSEELLIGKTQRPVSLKRIMKKVLVETI